MPVKSPRPGDLDPIETASRDEISALQLQRLQWSVRHTYDNVAPYRKRCEEAGVHPDDLQSLADLAKFPFMTKTDLRDNYPFGLFAVPRDKVARLHASSGTTGKSVVVGYTKRDLDNWADVVARSLRAAGVRAGDMVHNAYGYGMFTGGLGAHYGIERAGCTAVPMSGGQTEKQVQQIMDFRPDAIMVTPSYSLVIAEEFERLNIKPEDISLKIGIFGAEPWGEGMRSEIERKLGIDAIDIYGLTEVMGPGVASECIETKDGPVIWEDHFYPEIIDPDTGEVLPDGEEGELVFTSLTKEAFPVIRYRTRDLTRLLPPTARSFRRIGKITGRSDDMLIVRGVNVFPTQIEEQIMRDRRLSGNYQIVLTRDGHLDNVEIRVEVQRELSGKLSRTETENIARELQHHIKTIIGISTKVNVMEFEAIPRTLTGKARRVIDQRPKQL
ncbi:MAG TPA: phenylacetate--CoA ligase [Thauera aminoaromatica]|jgi:phenylacetate-CoA ligase|uniref:Phenylacetate-coenzyme A ligase n=2 Tax=Thauera aminoaromatica TaxID=164330 RepID=C4ZP71_THASP|nr:MULTISPECIES: phenylacetate--CoA ligase PaaK [Thauera]MDA0233679.1 phenylacetate--CoA ligase [Pseudomonadota bacterium]TMW75194.1 phenylacetate--CoA ligase [Thauera sp. UPWRP]ACK54267.1 phenylacetate-CoA ligase [Thauera aminoaromatica]ENO88122.1 phenylacetate-CoA ligase [Thauera aminoaromatica S2]KIN91258.1 phenylacetate-CoA ligase [Thauera sp. SWB20]